MSTDFSSARLLAVLGGALAFAALGFGVLTVVGARSASTDAAPILVHRVDGRAPATRHRAIRPAVKLLPSLPAPIRYALMRHRVVVVSLHGNGVVDASAAAEARAGAALAHTNLVSLDIRRDRWAGPIADFNGSAADPSVLVVRRPGVVLRRFDVYQDRQVIAQAAHDAR
jgi:hypothetical protein